MSEIMDLYKSKLITAAQAAAMVKSNSIVDYYAFTASSRYLDAALAQRAGELENVTIRHELRLAPPSQVFFADPAGKAFHLASLFRGPLENLVPAVRGSSTPARLSEYARWFETGDLRSDFASFMVSPPDKDGFLYFTPSPSLAKTDARMAKVFFAEINETYFPLRGSDDCRIHLSEVDYVIEGDNPPIMEIPNPPSTPVDEAIANHILKEIHDGACVQIGYGGLPEAVAGLIANSDLRDLGIHTEVFGEGLMKIYKAGHVTGARKATDPGKMIGGIVIGTRELYDFIRDCPDIYLTSSRYSNDPAVISRNENFIGVNAFIEIDLSGQVNAESIGNTTLSGTGGQLDFVIGAQHSPGGKSILCCPSTYVRKDGIRASRVVSTLTPGSIVTTPRSCMHYVCTEYGIVNLRGRSLWERAELLIGIAHPEFRDTLIMQAETLGVWRPSNRL